jgi:hypothetical protein
MNLPSGRDTRKSHMWLRMLRMAVVVSADRAGSCATTVTRRAREATIVKKGQIDTEKSRRFPYMEVRIFLYGNFGLIWSPKICQKYTISRSESGMMGF